MLPGRGVSPYHAVIRQVGGVFVVYDAGSRGGTFVNDKRIRGQPLKDADIIRVGGETVLFMARLLAPPTSKDPASAIIEGTSRLLDTERPPMLDVLGGPWAALTGPTWLGSLNLNAAILEAQTVAAEQPRSQAVRRSRSTGSTGELSLTGLSFMAWAQSLVPQQPPAKQPATPSKPSKPAARPAKPSSSVPSPAMMASFLVTEGIFGGFTEQPPAPEPAPSFKPSMATVLPAWTGDTYLATVSRLLAERAVSPALPRPKPLDPADLDSFMRGRLSGEGSKRR